MIKLSNNELLHVQLVPDQLGALVMQTLSECRGLLVYTSDGKDVARAASTYKAYRQHEAAQLEKRHQPVSDTSHAELRARHALAAGGAVIMLSGGVEAYEGFKNHCTYAADGVIEAEKIAVTAYAEHGIALIEQELVLQ